MSKNALLEHLVGKGTQQWLHKIDPKNGNIIITSLFYKASLKTAELILTVREKFLLL